MALTIPAALAAILPLLATMLSSYLNDDHLKPGINALIALVAILLTAIACELLAGGLIPGNPTATFIGVLGYTAILMQGDLATLYSYLVLRPSPLAPPAPARSTPTTSVVTKAYTPPTPITLPPNASPIPQRASVQPTDTPPSA